MNTQYIVLKILPAILSEEEDKLTHEPCKQRLSWVPHLSKTTNMISLFRDAGPTVGQGGSKVEGNGTNKKNKQTVTNMFVSVQQQY